MNDATRQRMNDAAFKNGQRARAEGRSEMPKTIPAEFAEAWRAGWYGSKEER